MKKPPYSLCQRYRFRALKLTPKTPVEALLPRLIHRRHIRLGLRHGAKANCVSNVAVLLASTPNPLVPLVKSLAPVARRTPHSAARKRRFRCRCLTGDAACCLRRRSLRHRRRFHSCCLRRGFRGFHRRLKQTARWSPKRYSFGTTDGDPLSAAATGGPLAGPGCCSESRRRSARGIFA